MLGLFYGNWGFWAVNFSFIVVFEGNGKDNRARDNRYENLNEKATKLATKSVVY